MLSQQMLDALDRDEVIDITTIGRKSGAPRRIEIWFHRFGGKTYITGTPGSRSWFANIEENPDFTFHLKQSIQADLPARATVIVDPAQRRQVLQSLPRLKERVPELGLDEWVANSPLIEVTFE